MRFHPPATSGIGPCLLAWLAAALTACGGPPALIPAHRLEAVPDSSAARRIVDSAAVQVVETEVGALVRADGLPDGARGAVQSSPSIPRGPATESPSPASDPIANRSRPREPPPRWIRLDGEAAPITLSVFDRPIADVAALIAEHAGMDIVLSDEPEVRETRITAEIRARPWPQALEAILVAHRLRVIQQTTGILTIVSTHRAEDERRPRPVRLRYLYAADLLPALQDVVVAGGDSAASVQVFGDPDRSRTLIAFASPEKLARIDQLVTEMDRRPPRVTVEVRMVHVNRTAMERLGVSYSFGMFVDSVGGRFAGVQLQPFDRTQRPGIRSDAGPAFSLIRDLLDGTPIRLNVFLDAATSAGIAETETTPLITSNSGITSEIMVGDAFILPSHQLVFAGGGIAGSFSGSDPFGAPGYAVGGDEPAGGTRSDARAPSAAAGPGFHPGTLRTGGFTEFETGTRLRVTPYVLAGEEIAMTIDLVRDGGTLSPDGRSIVGGRQSAVTEVTVENDTPIVIGGLTVNGRTRAESGIPGLARIPLLGRLFRTEEWATQYQDLVIVVTPHIHERDRAIQ